MNISGIVRFNASSASFAARRLMNPSRCYTHQYNFNSEEEIVVNRIDKVTLIGINLPARKNLLNYVAIEKLYDRIESFRYDDDSAAAVLHGCGGNFCTGADQDEPTVKKGRRLIEILHNLEKPIIGSLHGHIKNYGFQLALMCDIKAMDETALISFGDRNSRSGAPREVYQRLISDLGVSKAMEMTLTKCSWTAEVAKTAGLINQSVECGTALGQAVNWAQSIATVPIGVIINEKKKISSELCSIKMNRE